MTGGRFAHRVQAGLLVQEVHRLTNLQAHIAIEHGYYVVLVTRHGTEQLRPVVLRSWADWETWKLAHPDLVLGQLSFFPPFE